MAIYEDRSGVIDLGGRTVTPGFIEAHIHFLSYGLSLNRIDLMEVPCLGEALQRVRSKAQETEPGAGCSVAAGINRFGAMA